MRVHAGYGAAAVGYMLGIFLLSSSPGHADPRSVLISTVANVPLFAGLAWCLLLSLTDGNWYSPVSWLRYLLVVAVAGAYAGFDAWHLSAILGRAAGTGQWTVRMLAVVALVLVHRLRCTARTEATSVLAGSPAAPADGERRWLG